MEQIPNFPAKIGEQLSSALGAGIVFGTPIEKGEKTIIPVTSVMWGFGGGGGAGEAPASKKEKETDKPAGNPEEETPEQDEKGKKKVASGAGGGGGGGLKNRPLGVYEITDARTRFIPAFSPLDMIRPLSVLIGIGMVTRFIRILFRGRK